MDVAPVLISGDNQKPKQKHEYKIKINNHGGGITCRGPGSCIVIRH